jgi:hypothetical protein
MMPNAHDGTHLSLGLHVAADGTAREITPPPVARLPRTAWALRRETRADAGARPRQVAGGPRAAPGGLALLRLILSPARRGGRRGSSARR